MFNSFDQIGISNVKRFALAWIDKKNPFQNKNEKD